MEASLFFEMVVRFADAVAGTMRIPNGCYEGVPLIPSTHWLGTLGEFRVDRLAVLAGAESVYGPLGLARFGGFPMLMVSDPELIHEVLATRTEDFIQDRAVRVFGAPLFGRGVLTALNKEHDDQRRRLGPAFVHKRIAAYAPLMVARAEAAAASLPDGETVDVARFASELALSVMTEALFRDDVQGEADAIARAITVALEQMIKSVNSAFPLPPNVPTLGNLRQRAAVRVIDTIVQRLVDARRSDPLDRGDFLTALLGKGKGGEAPAKVDEELIADEARTIFLAGHETTANAIAWALHFLAEAPEAKAHAEREVAALFEERPPTATLSNDDLPKLPFLGRVWKETLRLAPPAYILARESVRATQVGHVRLPAGAFVALNIYGMHRSARFFEDPLRFDPDRFTPHREKALTKGAYLPFGAGPRTCIGAHFAALEGQLALATLLRRVAFEKVPGAKVTAKPLITLRPEGLRLRIVRRAPRSTAQAPSHPATS